VSFWFGVLVLLAIPVVWLSRRRTRAPGTPVDDPDELAEAERDVRDLDVFATPQDAARDLPDWGPGAPRGH